MIHTVRLRRTGFSMHSEETVRRRRTLCTSDDSVP